VVNLPPQVNRLFQGRQQPGAAESAEIYRKYQYPAGYSSDFPSDRPSETVIIDRPIPFYVLVIPNDRTGEIKELQSREWSVGEIEKLHVGFVKLELLPRGSGKLLVRAQQLFHTIKQDGTVDVSIDPRQRRFAPSR